MAATAVRKNIVSIVPYPLSFSFYSLDQITKICICILHIDLKSERSRTELHELDELKYSRAHIHVFLYLYAQTYINIPLY